MKVEGLQKQVFKIGVELIKVMKEFEIENHIETTIEDKKTGFKYSIKIKKINDKSLLRRFFSRSNQAKR